VTQRPSKVDRHIISQCDSAAVMKMTNRADIQLVHDAFGFLPDSGPRLGTLVKGEVLLAGSWIERPTFARTAPRRTCEGGRSLDDSWLRDPIPPGKHRP
jgi:DNA helicase HerA-like ATPase